MEKIIALQWGRGGRGGHSWTSLNLEIYKGYAAWYILFAATES